MSVGLKLLFLLPEVAATVNTVLCLQASFLNLSHFFFFFAQV